MFCGFTQGDIGFRGITPESNEKNMENELESASV